MEELERAKELFKRNLLAWEGEINEPKSLDSSLKRNTAFVRKLKTSINKESLNSVLKEINSLSLKKYEAELVTATAEGLLKCTKSADVTASIEIVSALHQRFSTSFTPALLSWFLQNLRNPTPTTPLSKKDEKERLAKVKVLLRLFTEFQSVALFDGLNHVEDVPQYITQRTKNGDSLLIAILKEVLGYNLKTGATLTVATHFAKRFPTLIAEDPGVNNIFKSYTGVVLARTEELHSKTTNLQQKKYKAQIRTGRTMEENEIEIEKLTNLFDEFLAAAAILAPLFDKEVPNFKEEEEAVKPTESIIISKDHLWSSDEDKRFYTIFPDIPVELTENDDTNKESRAQEMTEFLVQLETARSIKDVDEAAILFWKLKLNNKASKNRLLRQMITNEETSKARVYARFLKINQPYLEDVKEELIQSLDRGFRSQIYHRGINFKNIAFFCELIKFELIDEHVVFHKIRSLILNLSTANNIDILTIFFEITGKFLLHEHNKLMEEMLELLQLKRKSDKLSIANKMAISNLFLMLKPPSVKTLQQNIKVLKPEQLFMKQLIRGELNKKNYKKIRRLIQSVDPKDQETQRTIFKLFIKPEKINFENLAPLSEILRNMGQAFKIRVVDEILEQIVQGMESNDYRFNRKRIAHCKYITEICNRKIISVEILHDLVYRILTFGHPNNYPNWNTITELDPPDDYFRIQMVSVIFLNCEGFKLKANFGDKLFRLLKFFDYYIYLKDSPIPKDVEFKIVNTFNHFELARSADLKEALQKFNASLQSVVTQSSNAMKNPSNVVEAENGDDDEDEDDEEEDNDQEDDEDDEDDEDVEDEEDEEGEEQGDSQELVGIKQENKHLSQLKEGGDKEPTGVSDELHEKDVAGISYELYEKKLREQEEKKFDDDLEKEFNRIMSESLQHKRDERPSTTIDLPNNLRNTSETSQSSSIPKNKPKLLSANKIPFTLVTKKGKNIATKSLALPNSLNFANTIIEEEKRRREEKEKINRYILQSKYDD